MVVMAGRSAGATYAASETVTMTAIDANGVGKEIGALHLSDTKAGLQITPRLNGLPPGDHGFHVHANPNCGPGNGPDGKPAAGMAAGGHYDPANPRPFYGTKRLPDTQSESPPEPGNKRGLPWATRLDSWCGSMTCTLQLGPMPFKRVTPPDAGNGGCRGETRDGNSFGPWRR
jgi:hypothetical protein